MSDASIQSIRRHGADLFGTARAQRSDHAAGLCEPVSRVGRIPLRAEPTRADGGLSTPASADQTSGAVSGGGRGAPGSGDSHGDPFRPARGRGDFGGPNFNLDVPSDGYAWWYIDGVSECGTRAISIIAFIGSVFSPWYRWSGRKSPDNHVCINVATYGPGGRWTMTDRGRNALRQTERSFTVGPSGLTWDGTSLIVDINEISTPHGQRLKGQVKIHPSALTNVEIPLTPDGAHVWRPFAPTADIEVNFGKAGWNWSGHGYFDANFGTRALEADFGYWTWGRYPTKAGTASFYDVVRRDGSDLSVALSFDRDGGVQTMEAPPKQQFSRSLWAVKRETRADAGTKPRQVKHMLDAPFYNRCGVETTIHGETVSGVFEALDLDRFRGPWLMPMLAVRVPRRPNWRFDD